MDNLAKRGKFDPLGKEAFGIKRLWAFASASPKKGGIDNERKRCLTLYRIRSSVLISGKMCLKMYPVMSYMRGQ